MSKPPPPTAAADLLDAEGLVGSDVPCHRCGYNLRTRRPEQSCPECGAAVEEGLRLHLLRWRDDGTLNCITRPGRALYLLVGVVLPLLPLFMAAAASPGFDLWQSGEPYVMVALLLGGPPLWVMYPLLAAAMTGMTLVVIKPGTMGRRAVVRLGVYTGIPLALQMGVILTITIMESVAKSILPIGIALTGIVVFVGLTQWLRQRLWKIGLWWDRPWKWWTLIGGAALLSVVGWSVVLGGFLFTGPWWTLLAFVMLSQRVWRTPGGGGRSWIVLLLAWLGGYAAAWAGAVRLAIDAYAALPTQPNDCFVCGAATHGHAGFVGTRVVRTADGRERWTSWQFDRIKTFELALRRAQPGAHRAMRVVYDRVGPPLAKVIRMHPLLADMTHLALKPAEWLAAAALRAGMVIERRRWGAS